MTTTPFLEQDHDPDGCYRNRVQELGEHCDHEYYMSAYPPMTNKERASRGRSRILEGIKEFKQLLEIAKCASCRKEITRQILVQEEEVLLWIDDAWKA
jgi:hypothetical protein